MASSTLSRHVQFSDETTRSRYPSQLRPANSPQKKQQKMSITQTYYVAHTARAKLAAEASKPDHDLRLLVGHANLLDSLMLELADAEREQERWFNHTVKRAARSESPKPSRWADTIVEEPAEDWSAEDVDSMSESSEESEDGEWEYDEDDAEELDLASAVPVSKPVSLPARITVTPVTSLSDSEDSDVEEDSDSETGDLALVRTASHQPPELLEDYSEGESDEDSHMPPSPPQSNFVLSEKERQGIATTSFYDGHKDSPVVTGKPLSTAEQSAFFEEGFFLPRRAEVGAF